jgi:hypothetical protein
MLRIGEAKTEHGAEIRMKSVIGALAAEERLQQWQRTGAKSD